MNKKICDGGNRNCIENFALIFFCLLFFRCSLQILGEIREKGWYRHRTDFFWCGGKNLFCWIFHSFSNFANWLRATGRRCTFLLFLLMLQLAMIIGRLMFSAFLIALCFMLTWLCLHWLVSGVFMVFLKRSIKMWTLCWVVLQLGIFTINHKTPNTTSSYILQSNFFNP